MKLKNYGCLSLERECVSVCVSVCLCVCVCGVRESVCVRERESYIHVSALMNTNVAKTRNMQYA